uniref:Uncharacterized protein n=1 Tax=Rhizophora mucronata TaxID=61149 RepID=A0A2P2R2X2_RHIMU
MIGIPTHRFRLHFYIFLSMELIESS